MLGDSRETEEISSKSNEVDALIQRLASSTVDREVVLQEFLDSFKNFEISFTNPFLSNALTNLLHDLTSQQTTRSANALACFARFMQAAHETVIPKDVMATFMEVLKQVAIKLEHGNDIVPCLRFLQMTILPPRTDSNLITKFGTEISKILANDNTEEQVVVECFKALMGLMNQAPLTVATISPWFSQLLTKMVNKNPVTRDAANDFAKTIVFDIHSVDTKFIQPFLQQNLPQLMSNLSKIPSIPDQIKTWYFFTILVGRGLHRLDSIGQLLKVMEACFNHPLKTVKKQAHEAWIALIYNFMFDAHLFSQKRLNLLVSPLTCLSVEECPEDVKLAAMEMWRTLLYAVGPLNLDKFCQTLLWDKLPSAISSGGQVAHQALSMLERIFDLSQAVTPRGLAPMARIVSDPVNISDVQPFDIKLAVNNFDGLIKLFFGIVEASLKSNIQFEIIKVFDVVLSVIAQQSGTEFKTSPETIRILDNLISCLEMLVQPGGTQRWEKVLPLIDRVLHKLPERCLLTRSKKNLLPDGGKVYTTIMLQLLALVGKAPLQFNVEKTITILITSIMDKTTTLENVVNVVSFLPQLGERQEIAWMKLAKSFGDHLVKTGMVDENVDEEIASVLLYPISHQLSNDTRSVWKDLVAKVWTAAGKKNIVHLNNVAEKIKVPLTNSQEWNWGYFVCNTLFTTFKTHYPAKAKKQVLSGVLQMLKRLITKSSLGDIEALIELSCDVVNAFSDVSIDDSFDWQLIFDSIDSINDTLLKQLATTFLEDWDKSLVYPSDKLKKMLPLLQACLSRLPELKSWIIKNLSAHRKDWPQWLVKEMGELDTPKQTKVVTVVKKVESSGPTSSPSKRSTRSSANKAQKRGLYDLNSQEFTPIPTRRRAGQMSDVEIVDASPEDKRRKRRKADIPVMYNDLDQSQSQSSPENWAVENWDNKGGDVVLNLSAATSFLGTPSVPIVKEIIVEKDPIEEVVEEVEEEVVEPVNLESSDDIVEQISPKVQTRHVSDVIREIIREATPMREDTPTSSNDSFASSDIHSPLDYFKALDQLLEARVELGNMDKAQLFELQKKVSVLSASIFTELEKCCL